MRRAVVVTVLGTLGGCGSKTPTATPEPVISSNPPPPEVLEPSPEPVAPTTAPPGEHDRTRFTTVLNAQHPEHGRIYRGRDGGCYVNLPFPPDEGPPVSFRPPPTEAVVCPTSMADAGWLECAHGTVLAAVDDPAACLCAVMGNPPPPPRPIACPKQEG